MLMKHLKANPQLGSYLLSASGGATRHRRRDASERMSCQGAGLETASTAFFTDKSARQAAREEAVRDISDHIVEMKKVQQGDRKERTKHGLMLATILGFITLSQSISL